MAIKIEGKGIAELMQTLGALASDSGMTLEEKLKEVADDVKNMELCEEFSSVLDPKIIACKQAITELVLTPELMKITYSGFANPKELLPMLEALTNSLGFLGGYIDCRSKNMKRLAEAKEVLSKLQGEQLEEHKGDLESAN